MLRRAAKREMGVGDSHHGAVAREDAREPVPLRAMETTAPRYTNTAILLHWLLAALIFTLVGLGWYMVDIPRGTPERAVFYNLHKSIGVTAALFIALRIGWRATHPAPPLPSTLAAWERLGAEAAHRLLYACMVIMPLAGFTASNFTKYGVKFFGYPLPILGWEDEEVYRVFNGIHVYTSYVFVTLIALHVGAALKHLLADRDGVFQRMLPRR